MVRLVALDDKSEHVQDVITILVEAASWERITPGNLFGHPESTHLAERQPPVLPENVHNPHTMLKLLTSIHILFFCACKDNIIQPNRQMFDVHLQHSAHHLTPYTPYTLHFDFSLFEGVGDGGGGRELFDYYIYILYIL